MAARQLVEPDVGALREEDETGHPLAILGEPLGLDLGAGEGRRLHGAAAGTEPAEPGVQAVLLLGEDADRDVEPGQQLVERATEQPAPMLANEPELADQRVRRDPGRLAEDLEEGPGSVAFATLDGDAPRVALEGRDRRPESVGRQDPLIDEIAERSSRRIDVRQMDEQEVLEPSGRVGLDPGKALRKGRQELAGRSGADRLADRRECVPDRDLRLPARGRDNRQVGRLVEQAECQELAGERLSGGRVALGVEAGDDRAGRGRLEGTLSDVVRAESEVLEGGGEEGDALHGRSVACRCRSGARLWTSGDRAAW